MNVFEFAKKMELDGKDFYEKQAATIEVPGLKKIFRQLAEDEQKHYDALEKLQQQKSTVANTASTALDEAKNVFQDLIASDNKPTDIKGGDLEGYRYAMKVEADSFRLYEQAAAEEKDEKVRKVLLWIAEEEHKHFNILESVYDFVNAPNEFLAWGEFSNLDEFRNFGRDVDVPEGKSGSHTPSTPPDKPSDK